MTFDLSTAPTRRQMELLGNYLEAIEWGMPTFTGYAMMPRRSDDLMIHSHLH